MKVKLKGYVNWKKKANLEARESVRAEVILA